MLLELADKFNSIENGASSWLHNATEKATSLDDRLIDGIGNSIGDRFNFWLTQHPAIAWTINHPIISLVVGSIALILTIRLLITVYRAIASAIDRMWLWILRSPWLLLKFLFGWERKPQTDPANTFVTNYQVSDNPEQLQDIVERLDKIQRQQEQIINELGLLKQQPITIEPELRSLLDAVAHEGNPQDRAASLSEKLLGDR